MKREEGWKQRIELYEKGGKIKPKRKREIKRGEGQKQRIEEGEEGQKKRKGK